MSPSLSALAPLWQKNHISGKAFSSLKRLCGCITIFLLLNAYPLNAQIQVYPVSLTTQLTPPYSVNLADYVAPGCEQLKLIILQRDLTQSPYMLYLKMEILLNGRVIIRTSTQYVPPPITLDPGIPTVISGSDLYPFFDPANMEFMVEDIRENYLRTRILPEGAYVISFTAYDFTRRDVALSNGGSMFCYLAKTDPPLLNFPLNNTGVPSSPSQFINFQWLSRSTASPNSAQSTRYKLDLFEIRLDGRNPAEIVQSMRPLFTVETDRTTFLYSISDPFLEAGLRYAWRIRAFDINGRDYIRNDGYSEVFSFVYGVAENMELPSDKVANFTAIALSPRKVKLKWDASTDFDSYKVLYRKQGGDAQWFEDETIQNTFELNGLSSGNIYDCRVQGKKNSIWGGFSDIDTVLLPIPRVIECGSQYQTGAISNREPILTLMKMQEIEAGGFIVTVIDALNVNGVPGRFTGRGFVQVPLFAHKKIRCEFTNIFVNTDYQLAEGTIHLMVDKSEGGDNAMWDVDEIFEGGSNNGQVISGTEGVSITLPDVVISGEGAISIDTAKKEILIQAQSGEVIRTDISQQLEEKAKTITIKDSEGNIYSVDTQSGKATSIGKAPTGNIQMQPSIPSSVSSGKAIVYFEAIPGETKYAFDKRDILYSKSSLFTEEYNTLKMDDGTLYDVPFKLIPAGETDIVLVKTEIKDKTIKADSIVFQTSTGTIYSARHATKEGQYILTLPSGKENDGIEIFALYPRQGGQPYLLGKLTVISYSVVRPKVMLVPVNGNSIDPGKVKEELDKVYLRVGVDWQVSIDDSDFTATADSLDVIGSGLFSQYTPGMKKLNSAFIAHQKDYDPSTLYIFILIISDDMNATGDMPRSKQFAYLFRKTALMGGEEVLYRTIAHELSHGTFNLNHTFDSNYQIAKGATKNLMDYSDGTVLVKHQWDAIHDPGLVIGMFERDEEGMMSLPCLGWFDDCDNVIQMLEKIRNARINSKTIKINGQENSEEYTLVANSVKIAETDYKKIRLIYKPEREDYNLDPTKYGSYYQQFLVANGSSDVQNGFVYYKGTTPLFKIVVDDDTSKIGRLKEYLFGSGISFEIRSKNKTIKEGDYIKIDSIPEMPEIKVKNTSSSDVMFRLRIEYRRDIRADEDYFPGSEWKTLKAGDTWNITFGDKTRGGKATLLYKTGSKEFSFVFYIRGVNPTEQEVKAYITQQGYDIWFLTRMIRQESSYHQFNEGKNYGPDWSDYVGCPNFNNNLHGWGLMQLDKLNSQTGDHQVAGGWRPSAQALWNWKENVRVGVAFLQGEKFDMVNTNLNTSLNTQNDWYSYHPNDIITGHADESEGNGTRTITYTHANSTHFTYDFGGNPTGVMKSFMEASWIKNYNGSSGGTDGSPGFYYVLKQKNQSTKPSWGLHRTNSNNENYVGFVSGREE